MRYLYLYKAIAPRNPETGEIDDFKKPNLETFSYIAATAVISALVIVSLWVTFHS